MIIPAATLATLLLAGQPRDPCEGWMARLQQVDPGDPVALLDLGGECEAGGCPRVAALAYERILRDRDAPDRRSACEAGFRLARLEIRERDYDSAFARLRRVLLECPDHQEARDLLQGAETEKTREQILAVEQGDAAMAAGRWAEAIALFEKAHGLVSPEDTASAYIPRSAVLSRLAECRSRLEDAAYQGEFLPRNRSVQPCPACQKSSPRGFIACPACGGKGKVEARKKSSVMTGTSREKTIEPCARCNGYGYHACGECWALGYVAGQITPRERKALRDLALSVAEPRVLERPLAAAMAMVEDALLDFREGAALNYLRAMKPEYAHSAEIKKRLAPVMAGAAPPKDAQDQWKKAESDQRIKINFLVNYACEFAEHLRHFEMLRAGRRTVSRRWAFAEPWTEPVISPEALAAFPEEAAADLVAVEGTFESWAEGAPGEHKGYLTVRGEARHGIAFFVWLPSARKPIEQLGKSGAWKQPLDGLAEAYPFDQLSKAAAGVPKEHRIVLIGRFLRDVHGYPRNWFEVWRFQIGLSTTLETAFRKLRARVDLSLPCHTPAQIAGLFSEWLDVDLSFDGLDDASLVSCEAREGPLGLIVDAIAKALGAEWRLREGGIVVGPAGVPTARGAPVPEDVGPLLERLLGERTPRSDISAARCESPAAAEPSLPPDPAGLRVAARQAVLAMRFDVAARCFDALGIAVEDPPVAGALAAIRAKLRLFHELTARTPVSRLAGADELAEIVYQKPSGDLVGETVVLAREGDAWRVQEAYGASFTIRPELVKKVTPISAADWKTRKRAEIERRERELGAVEPGDLPSKLFLLAIFAKTHSIAELGAAFLDRAIEAPEFEEFLRRLYPGREAELIRLWRQATGRDAGPVAGPTTTPSPPARPTEAEAPPPLETIPPLREDASDGEILSHARRHAKDGSECARRVLEGDAAAEWRRRAIACFDEAERDLTKYLERRPGDPAGLRLQLDIQAMRAACVKDMGFFE